MSTSTMQWLGRGAAAAYYGTKQKLEASVNEDTVRLAVTGLSRAGKTVFITSVIQNLMAMGDGIDSLPALNRSLCEAGKSRLRGVRLIPPGDSVIPWFDQPANVAALSLEQPVWPRPTDQLAEISLALDIERKGMLGRTTLGQRRVRLDILDYPGEWLLDLPLLEQTYQAWSRQTLEMFRTEPRLTHAKDFLAYLQTSLRSRDGVQEELIRKAHALYKEALVACQKGGLRFLQPGRFLRPGPEGDGLPMLWFFPMDVPDGPPPPGSVAELLIKRFERYQHHVREQFVLPYLRRFNRQVLLVDVLRPLHAGKAAFEDTALAIGEVTRCLGRQKIGRVVVCVSAWKRDPVSGVIGVQSGPP